MLKIYGLYDKISKSYKSITLACSDSDFVRQSLYAILMDYPLTDVEAYCLGEFNDQLGYLVPVVPRLVDWECYKFPKQSDSLTPSYLSLSELCDSASEKLKEFNQKYKDKLSDFNHLLDDVNQKINHSTDNEEIKSLRLYRDNILNTIKDIQERYSKNEKHLLKLSKKVG